MKPAIPADPTLRWEWIKYQLRVRGSSFSQVARELDVTRAAVLQVKRVAYPRMERVIARKLDRHPGELWPERWNADGTPRRERPKRAETNLSARRARSSKDSGSNARAQRIAGEEV